MKIAITAERNDPGSQICSRFGRAPGFLVMDDESQQWKFISNEQNLHAAQGAGIQAARHIVNNDIEVLITGHCGPKAFRVLSESGVRVFHCKNATIKQALKDYQDGNLQRAEDADVEGHWM